MPSSLRDELIDAAATVLRDEGPAAVTTKRIARAAGCSEGSIYNHFQTKQELLACVVTERIGGFKALPAELRNQTGQGDMQEHLHRVAGAATAFYRDRLDVLALALRDPDASRDHFQAAHEAGLGPWHTVESLADWLRAEQRLGRVHPDADPVAAMTALLGSCHYQVVMRRLWTSELAPDDDTIAERAVTAVWPGLAPTHDPASDTDTTDDTPADPSADTQEAPRATFHL